MRMRRGRIGGGPPGGIKKIQILDMIKPFVTQALLLLMACSSGLMVNAASAASTGHKKTATKTSPVRKRTEARSVGSSHRKGKDWRKGMVTRRQKERRLSGKMAVAIRRTQETEERKTAAIMRRMTGDKHAAVTGASASLVDGGIESTNKGLGSFESRKGHLPWPVDSRTIAIPFGPYKYMRDIIDNNKGIRITTEGGAVVQSVADGKVQEVFPDLDAVMISHGTYFTTYINLSTIIVCKGEEIKAGQVIGSVGADGQLDLWLSDGEGRMLDPEKWLKR
jgi:septal ring factor EnvC (AmiA/AmiB activator)